MQGTLFLGLFLAAITALVLVIYRESLLEKSNKSRLPEATSLDDKSTGKLLNEATIEPIPSVTDRTTELLYAEQDPDQPPGSNRAAPSYAAKVKGSDHPD